jgi:hypothetical protein
LSSLKESILEAQKKSAVLEESLQSREGFSIDKEIAELRNKIQVCP